MASIHSLFCTFGSVCMSASPTESRPHAVPLKQRRHSPRLNKHQIKQKEESIIVPSPVKRRARRLLRFHHFGHHLSLRRIERMLLMAQAIQDSSVTNPNHVAADIVILHY